MSRPYANRIQRRKDALKFWRTLLAAIEANDGSAVTIVNGQIAKNETLIHSARVQRNEKRAQEERFTVAK